MDPAFLSVVSSAAASPFTATSRSSARTSTSLRTTSFRATTLPLPRRTHRARLPIHTPPSSSAASASSSTTEPASATSAPRIIISGAPASGKGTQCALIVSAYNLVHLSTGDMLRAAVAAGSTLGVAAKAHMDAGALVPDELVIELVIDRVTRDDCSERGWLLDGFPRTQAQALALDKAAVVADAVVCLDVEDDVLVERVVGRRMDPVTGDIYHADFNPPPPGDVADRCVQRVDDTREKAVARLGAFHKNAEAIEEHYANVLTRVDGARGKMDVFGDVKGVINAVVESKKTGGGGGDKPERPESSGAAATDGGVASREEVGSDSSTAMPVAEFVRRAEEAYEQGFISTSATNYSGQAGADSAGSDGTKSYRDLGQRWGLAAGDLTALLAFAYVGQVSHGGGEGGLGVLKTAAPFVLSWFLVSPLTGAYLRAATCNVKTSLTSAVVPVALSTAGGVGLRSVIVGHSPPPPFVIVSLIATYVLIGGWRSLYTSIRGDETSEYRRGGLGDGFAMVGTLLRRW